MQTDRDEKWVAHTYYVKAELEALLSDLAEPETSQRGYIITDEEAYLTPFAEALARVRQRTETVRGLTGDNPAQQRALDKLEPPSREIPVTKRQSQNAQPKRISFTSLLTI